MSGMMEKLGYRLFPCQWPWDMRRGQMVAQISNRKEVREGQSGSDCQEVLVSASPRYHIHRVRYANGLGNRVSYTRKDKFQMGRHS